MNIGENRRKGMVTVNGHRIAGSVTEDTCPRCSGALVYYEKYDADFCPQCNEWRNVHCGNPACAFCRRRPQQPLPQVMHAP